jgi:hypothetical protein
MINNNKPHQYHQNLGSAQCLAFLLTNKSFKTPQFDDSLTKRIILLGRDVKYPSESLLTENTKFVSNSPNNQ